MRGYRRLSGKKQVFDSPLPIVLLSLLFGFIIFAAFRYFTPSVAAYFGPTEQYCVLTVDENIPDRKLAEIITAAGFETVYSESKTMVFFDDFGKWKSFSLDSYRDFVEPFDPRDDGYAEKLRAFFTGNGERKFFIPIETNVLHGAVRRKLTAALEGIPFTIGFLYRSEVFLFWFLLQAVSLLCALFFSCDKKRFAVLLPVLLAFSFGAFPGVILSCILAGIFELLYEPLRELFSRNPYGKFRERFRPYKKVFLRLGCFLVLFALLTIFFDIPHLPVVIGFICFVIIDILSFRESKKKNQRSSPFIPVLILPSRQKAPGNKSMAALALIAVTGSLLYLASPDFLSILINSRKGNFPFLPTALEYQEHMTYQAFFSYTPLGSPNAGYHNYYLGEDGLIAGYRNPGIIPDLEIPPFPLDKLSRFLIDYGNRTGDMPDLFIKEWFGVALIFLLFIRRRAVKSSSNKNKIFPIRAVQAAA